MIEALSGSLVAIITVAGVALTAMFKRKSEKETTSISWYDKLTERVDALERARDEDREKMGMMQTELEEVKMTNFGLRALIQEFVEYVKQWRRLLPQSEWPEPPDGVSAHMDKPVE